MYFQAVENSVDPDKPANLNLQCFQNWINSAQHDKGLILSALKVSFVVWILKKELFQKHVLEIPSECQIGWIKINPTCCQVWSWSNTVCKGL